MVHSIYASKRQLTYCLTALTISCLALLTSCATQFSSEPTPSQPTQNSVSLDEFYTPSPSGEADDYYLLLPGEDDNDYSYFLDEQDYYTALDHGGDAHYKFIHNFLKKGHGYGDLNHIHVHIPGPHHFHGVHIGIKHTDWTDSLALTDSQKVKIGYAMIAFRQCAAASVDSFQVALKPFREEFRDSRIAILNGLDSDRYSRDSARALLDSAIVKYEAETNLLRSAFAADLSTCLAELDVAVRAILTPVQYAIWVRHRGW